MKILLNNRLVNVDASQSRQPLLNWLREQQNMKASKEGCGAGDCGACTVLLGCVQDGQLHYQAANACIALLGSVVGRHVVTLEGLSPHSAQELSDMHPVQQALVDYHASQCGFCTPGIVMAMWVWWLNTPANPMHTAAHKQQHEHAIEQALSGNLCRCTGYHPILQAAASLAPFTQGAQEERQVVGLSHQQVMAYLAADGLLADESTTSTLNYQLPSDEAALALAIDAAPNATLICGGTDLGLEVTQQSHTRPAYIDLSQVTELQSIAIHDGYLCIGGGVTFSQLQDYLGGALLAHNHMALAWQKLLPLIGSTQVRNRGTIAGNIANASPIADSPPLLLALEAELELVQTQKKQHIRVVPLAKFYTGYRHSVLQPGEYIRSIRVPMSERQVFLEKISKRHEDDISAVCMALVVNVEQGVITHFRLGLGGMAATPVLASKLETALLGMAVANIDAGQLMTMLQQDVTPMSDVRASAAYRSQVCVNLLQYWLQDAQVKEESVA